ncbi:MAG: hypothetical protein H8E55_66860, partial [Pelagibacterales bacterium]|nr:hypothetical protein [Pelagibacterales bacterium]
MSDTKSIAPEFFKIMKDFLNDILITFPEYAEKITDDENLILNGDVSNNNLYIYCCGVYPSRFFDILYKNDEMFDDKNRNTCFLPNIDFNYFFKQNITQNTKDTLWKYLQLILFTIAGNINDQECFGDTAKLFEAIDEDVLKSKIEDTIKDMGEMFDLSGMNFEGSSQFFDGSGQSFDGSGINMPNPDDLNNHINSLMEGKLGKLASEIAEETAKEMSINLDEEANVNDVMGKLFKNPGKLLSMVKKVGSKLDEKIKSGEIKESELMEEASELMKKMKNMPGMAGMEGLFSKMGIPNSKKMNFGAMENKLNTNIRNAKTKERMRSKLEKRRAESEAKKFVHTTFTGNNSKIEKSSINGKEQEEATV